MLRSSLLVWECCELMEVRVHCAIKLDAWNAPKRMGGIGFM
jgi:hypothetical protein